MILDFQTVQSITCGAEEIREENGWFTFYRMSKKQRNVYRGLIEQTEHTLAPAGVKLAFYTDSKVLQFTYTARVALRSLFHFDLRENDVLTYHSPDPEENDIYDTLTVPLSAGEKKVELYLPFIKQTTLSDITLDDGASVRPVERKRKMLCYGDSITQGYSSPYPSLTYAMQLGRALGFEVINRGIGSDKFTPALARCEEMTDADFVTVAYGTNDWRVCKPEDDQKNIFGFMQAVCERFDRVFYIAPLWRHNPCWQKITHFPFDTEHYIEFASEVLQNFPQVHIINPWNFVGHDLSFYAPDGLHPNTLGHTLYARELAKEIKREIEI